MSHRRMRIIFVITVNVMVAVIPRPPRHPTLIGRRATIGNQKFDRTVGLERRMGIKPVETYGHAQPGMPGNLQNDKEPD